MNMNSLFSLPNNIISYIYEMDATYRDKFQNEIKTEIFKTSWVRFINMFIYKSIFKDEPIVSRKLKFIFEYLQSIRSGYDMSLPSDQITITSFCKRLISDENEEYELYVDIQLDTRRFECMVYTYSEFENKDPSDWIRERHYCEVKVYENNEFKLVQILRR